MRAKLAVVTAVALVVALLLFAVDRHRGAAPPADAGGDTSAVPDAGARAEDAFAVAPTENDASTALDGEGAEDGGGAFTLVPVCSDDPDCEGVRGDPWAVESRSFARGDGACGMKESTREIRLRYASDGGAATHALMTLEETCPEGSGVGFRFARAFDFDGDGERELLLGMEHGGSSGVTAQTGSVWTFKDGALALYEPTRHAADASAVTRRDGGAAAIPNFTDVDDVDHDGRPDLLTRGTYEASATVRAGGTKVVMLVPPLFVLHSLADGTFSATDDVAKKHVATSCTGAGPLEDLFQRSRGDDFDRDGFDQELAKAVVCDRARGRSEAEVNAVLHRWCNKTSADPFADPNVENAPGGGNFVCADWTYALAKPTPPTQLR